MSGDPWESLRSPSAAATPAAEPLAAQRRARRTEAPRDAGPSRAEQSRAQGRARGGECRRHRRGRDSGRIVGARQRDPAAPVATVVPATPTTRHTVTSTTPTCDPAIGAVVADVDGDGCDEVLGWSAGVLTTPAGEFAVGEPGDELLVGDWDCDGRATPGLYRPATGAVFLFDAWAETGTDLTVEPVRVVPGGEHATAADLDGDGCTEVVVHDPSGEPVVVSGAGAQPRSPASVPPG